MRVGVIQQLQYNTAPRISQCLKGTKQQRIQEAPAGPMLWKRSLRGSRSAYAIYAPRALSLELPAGLGCARRVETKECPRYYTAREMAR